VLLFLLLLLDKVEISTYLSACYKFIIFGLKIHNCLFFLNIMANCTVLAMQSVPERVFALRTGWAQFRAARGWVFSRDAPSSP
jgi:hypothetical protein